MASCTSGISTGTGMSEPVGLPEKERTKERGIEKIQKKKIFNNNLPKPSTLDRGHE